MLGHKTRQNKFKRTEIISSIFSDHNSMKLEANLRNRGKKKDYMETKKQATKKKKNQRVNMESKRKSEDTLKLLYTLDKGGKSTELRGKKVSSMQCWKSWTDAYKSRKSEQSLTPYINSINTILFSRRSSQPRD